MMIKCEANDSDKLLKKIMGLKEAGLFITIGNKRVEAPQNKMFRLLVTPTMSHSAPSRRINDNLLQC